MIGGQEIERECGSDGFRVIGLLVDLCLFFHVVDRFATVDRIGWPCLAILGERWGWVHRIDAFLDSLIRPFSNISQRVMSCGH